MKSASRFLFIFIILSSITLGLKAQDENYVLAYGKLKVEWGNTDNTTIVLYEDNKEIDDFRPQSNGKFQFSLELNHTYMFWFQKPGYVTKKVQFETMVPESVTSDPEFIPFPDFDFYVTLFESYPEVDTMFFTKPVGKIQYNNAINDFDWDKDYTLEIQRSMELIEKEITEKHEQKIKDDEEKENQAAEAAIQAEKAKKEKERLAEEEKERIDKEEKEAKRLAAIELERQQKVTKEKEKLAAQEKDTADKAKKDAEKQAVLDKAQEEKEAKEVEKQASLKKEQDEKAQREAEELATKNLAEADKVKKQAENDAALEKEAQIAAEKQARETKEKEESELITNEVKTETEEPLMTEVIPEKEVSPEKIQIIEDKPALAKQTNEIKPKPQRVKNAAPQKTQVSNVEVAGKTTTQTSITYNGITLIYIKVVYTWGGKYFFIQDEDKAFRNISENYYNTMISKK